MGSGSSSQKQPESPKYADSRSKIPVSVRSKKQDEGSKGGVVFVGAVNQAQDKRRSLPAIHQTVSAPNNGLLRPSGNSKDINPLAQSINFVMDNKSDLDKEDKEMEELLRQHDAQQKERKMVVQFSQASEPKPLHPTLSVESQPAKNIGNYWSLDLGGETKTASAAKPTGSPVVKQSISPVNSQNPVATAPVASPAFAYRTSSQDSSLGANLSVDAPKPAEKKDVSNYWSFSVSDYAMQTTPNPVTAPKAVQEPSNYWSFNVVSNSEPPARQNVKPKLDPNEFFATLQAQADKLGVRRC